MGDIIKTGFKLFLITAVAAMALGLTNAATANRIEEQAVISRKEAKLEVLPLASEFEKLDFTDYDQNHPMILEVHEGIADGERKGYTFRVLSEGFTYMELYVGIDILGHITGVNVVFQRETPGLGTRATAPAYTSQFIGLPALNVFDLVRIAPDANEIQAISGATVSSGAIVNAINAVVEFYTMLLKED